MKTGAQRRFLILLLAGLGAGSAVGADSRLTIGANPDLVAGAEALELGRFALGIERTRAGLDQAVTREQRASGLNNLCAGYVALGQYDVAVVHCSASLGIDPANWQAYNNRAIAYLGKGMPSLALRDVRRGLKLSPEAARLRKVESMVDAALRRRQTAIEPDPLA